MNSNNQNSDKNNQEAQQGAFHVNSINLGEMFNDHNTKAPTIMHKKPSTKNEEINKPIHQETKGLDALVKNQEDIDQLYQVNMDKQWSMLDKWGNRSMYNHVQEVKQELFKTSAQYRLSFYKTMLDTRLEYLNEKCNAGLKMVKGHYRQQVSSFLMSKMEQLSYEVRDRQFAFITMMKEKYTFAETLTAYPSMQQHYIKSIFNEEEKYLKFLDGLLDKFQSIVDEELRKY